ncbi:MAG: spore coat protein [Bacillota bacterium]
MVKFGMREAVEMYDILGDTACVIDHFSDYISHCQDPALRQILEKQQRHMLEEYNQKMNAVQSHGIDVAGIQRVQSEALPQQGMAAGVPGVQGNTQFGMQQAVAGQSQYQAGRRAMNDRTIARGALLFHKCGANRATAAALESAEPHLRNLMAASARTCMDMAYEIFNYMVQRGFYQTPEVPVNFVNHMQGQGVQNYQGVQHTYAGVQQNYQGMQQAVPGMQQNYQAGVTPKQYS